MIQVIFIYVIIILLVFIMQLVFMGLSGIYNKFLARSLGADLGMSPDKINSMDFTKDPNSIYYIKPK